MPQATLSASRIAALLGQTPTREVLEPVVFRSKAEIARWEGDELVVEVTPDRLDLLTESGLALHLAGALGLARGLPALGRLDLGPATPRIDVDASVGPLRPAIAGVLLTAPVGGSLDLGLLSEAIRFQELLHATVGADRREASLGIYPWERLSSPVRYALEPTKDLRFVPLDQDTPTTADDFLATHPLARRYGSFGRAGDRCLTLRDGKGTLLSLPPILNTRAGGEARAGDRVLLLESTGLGKARVQDMLGLLMLVFVMRDWKATPVAVESGTGLESGEAVTAMRPIPLTASRLVELSGWSWDAAETEHRIAEVRLGAHPTAHGWRVEVPPWRPDLLTEVDIAEDLILARGVRTEDALVAPSRSRGRRRRETRFRERAGELLLGLGYTQLYTPVLTSRASVARLGRASAVALSNPPSEQFALFRDILLLPLVDALEHNVRFGYPQRLQEVGPVIRRVPGSESGAITSYHAATVFAGEGAGFAGGASMVDYLLTTFGAAGVREPANLPGTIPGRSAVVRLAGERVAEMGEVHPEILAEAHIPVPVVWTEVDLSALWPLMRPGEAD